MSRPEKTPASQGLEDVENMEKMDGKMVNDS
jgi:hypothetical protein